VSVRRPPAGGARGQHFLRSSRLADTLVREAGVEPGQLVVDLGAGRGALTAALLRAGAEVIAVERDPLLAGELRARFPHVRVVEADARRWTWPAEPFAVVANLPFAAAAAILRSLLDDPRVPLRRAHLIVQWELAAKRTAAWPSTLRSVHWGAWWELSIARRLAASAFAPAPPVVAAVLAVERREPPLLPQAEWLSYRSVLEGLWADRPLRRTLPFGVRELKRLADYNGFDERALPRDLDARQWAALYGRYSWSSQPRSRSQEASSRQRGRASSRRR
jgi:23S rRNA (adenine-N6)-dimethyltransferase